MKKRANKDAKKEPSKTKLYGAIGGCCIVIIAIGVIAALSNVDSDTSAVKTTAPNLPTVDAGGLDIGTVALDFSLVDPQKGPISKQTFEDKPLFIFFTTTWCAPCQIGAKNLAKYDQEVGDNAFNVLIIFVDPNESNEDYIKWKKEYGRKDWFIAESPEMARDYNVKFLDSKFLLDGDGIIKYFSPVPLTYEDAKGIIEPYIR